MYRSRTQFFKKCFINFSFKNKISHFNTKLCKVKIDIPNYQANMIKSKQKDILQFNDFKECLTSKNNFLVKYLRKKKKIDKILRRQIKSGHHTVLKKAYQELK